ncbi:MAG: hypothetical protein QXI54_00115 [Archaeoglobaceae archaeon]
MKIIQSVLETSDEGDKILISFRIFTVSIQYLHGYRKDLEKSSGFCGRMRRLSV